jgi:hypothetical protein
MEVTLYDAPKVIRFIVKEDLQKVNGVRGILFTLYLQKHDEIWFGVLFILYTILEVAK